MDTVTARRIDGLPLVDESHDLGSLIDDSLRGCRDDFDLLCVASTVVSKSEGRRRSLESYDVSDRARSVSESLEDADPRFVEAVLDESVELLIEDPFMLAVTSFGHVAPNAGRDRSNVEGDDTVLLLPEDPSESARRISDEVDLPVVITDTCGRPFREGQTGVAVGWHGLDPMKEWRGETDLNGRELEVTREALADEIAGFANLLMGEGGDGVPAVALSGLDLDADKGSNLFRPKENDLVRRALLETK